MSQIIRGAVSCCQRCLFGVGAAALLCIGIYFILVLGEVGENVRNMVGTVQILSPAPVLGLRPPSALLQPPTYARCSQLNLQGPLANVSAWGRATEPGAVKDPVTGEWLMFFTYQEEVPVACTGGKQQGCPAGKQGGGSTRTRHVPLMLRLGFGALPDLRLAQTEVQRVQLHESYLRLRQQQGASSLKASSWRPFAWRGAVYLSHWLSAPPSQDKVALARLDLEHNSLALVYRFDTLEDELARLNGQRGRTHDRSTSTLEQMTDLEAGWGFVPEERSLLIFTSILPCTVALEYDDSVPDGVTLRNRHCYDEAAAKIEAYTGLNLWEQEDMLISGHPVAWDIEHGSKYRELLVIVHKHGYNAEHWAVRINRATQRVTHVTAGPLLHRHDYKPDALYEPVISLSTYHIIDQGEQFGSILRVVYGEEDHLFCWMDIKTEAIVWHPVPASRGAIKTQTRMRFKASGTIS